MRDKLWDPETSRLRRSFRLGPSAAAGYADDYTYLISGLLDLYQVCHMAGQLIARGTPRPCLKPLSFHQCDRLTSERHLKEP